MSDDLSDGELTDALLDLIDTTEVKKKRRRSSNSKPSSKRHKLEMQSDSGDEPESEEDAENQNPYPLEGKYKDEEDRLRIMEMPEVEREGVLSQRADELQRFQEGFKLNLLVKQQAGGGDDSVSSAAKRKHTVRGATKAKADKLSELRATRKAKDERRKAGHKNNSPKRQSSVISDDMDISDEDGEINKDQQLEDRARHVFEKPEKDELITMQDMEKVLLTRENLSKHYVRPWFEEYVKGCFVRYLIGQDGNEPVYRLCEVTNIAPETSKPYKVNDQMMNQLLELKHAKYVKCFMMDKVSNTAVTQREFDRYIKTSQYEKEPIPTKRQLERKHVHITKLTSQSLTESDIAAMLERKKSMQPGRANGQASFLQKGRLQTERQLAIAREDFKEAAAIDEKLKLMEEASAEVEAPKREIDANDLFARVNERNRQRNLESIRKAEAEAAARKKLERKALASGTATPTLAYDPSARLRTVPKLFNNRSRGVTPNGAATPTLTPPINPTGGRSPSPLPMPAAASTAKGAKSSLESNMLNVEIDLGDF